MREKKEPDFPKRPPRLKWIFSESRSLYFVTFNTRQRQSILVHSAVHEAFVTFCERGHQKGIAVGDYVIMPDHVHLFVALPINGMNLGQWVGALKMALGRTLIDLGQDKPHWQEGFFDRLLRNADSYSEKWDYVRMNPVRKGLCAAPEDWTYQGQIEVLRF
ncbi:MAG: transposase [Opitutaceae bacterium]